MTASQRKQTFEGKLRFLIIINCIYIAPLPRPQSALHWVKVFIQSHTYLHLRYIHPTTSCTPLASHTQLQS